MSRMAVMAVAAFICAGTWNSLPVAAAPQDSKAPAISLNYVVFDQPTPFVWSKDAPKRKGFMVPLLVDWNGDGRQSLLVCDTGGRLLLLRIEFRDDKVNVTSMEPVCAGGNEISIGGAACVPSFVDITGDGLPDIILSMERQVLMFQNLGPRNKPAFADWVFLGSAQGAVVLPEKAGPRVEVADWNGDGLPDLIASDFDGQIIVYLNKGRPQHALFDTGTNVMHEGKPLKKPYAPQVRFMDVNGDGTRDLVLGMNWGTIVIFPNKNRLAFPAFRPEIAVKGADGKVFEGRKVTQDYIFPTFGDIDGDGNTDMIFGGSAPELFFAKGIRKF